MLGSPIGHSMSPTIHRAAYAVLGLDWHYEAIDVSSATLPSFMAGLDSAWRGLSLTMPLKRNVIGLLDWVDPVVQLVGGANTVAINDDGLRGFNTDVEGALRSFLDAGIGHLDSVWIIGAGATAASMLVASARLGATNVEIFARTPSKAAALEQVALSLGVTVSVHQLTDRPQSPVAPTAIISTVPGGAMTLSFAQSLCRSTTLFDVAYDPWPSEIARQWYAAGGLVISGHDLLINQAIAQIRIFAGGSPDHHLPHEADAIDAMHSALEASAPH
ncbi:MAG: shikimate dehydrogenase family protein [Rhodoglobus sp.]